MSITIAQGVTSVGLTISSGDPLFVLSGGRITSTTILSGGSATLSAGSDAEGITVSHGGVVMGPGDLDHDSTAAGSVSGVRLVDSGSLEILSGGVASGISVLDNSLMLVDSGGIASGGLLSSGYLEDGGSAYGIDVGNEGGLIVYSMASGDTVHSGGYLAMDDGAVITDDTVLSGGSLYFNRQLAGDFTLASGAVTNTTVLSGVTVSKGGEIIMQDATVLSGATLSLAAGAFTVGVTVSKGGVLLGPGELNYSNFAYGVVSGVTVASGNGYLDLMSGSVANGVTVTYTAMLNVELGGSASGTVVSSGSEVVDRGSAAGTVISNGGLTRVFAGGVTAATAIQSGGRQVVYSGGPARATTVQSGGVEYVLSAGADYTTVVSSGGTEIVSSGAAAVGLSLLSGGVVSDIGQLRFTAAGTLAGTLESNGAIVKTGAGDLLLSGVGGSFTGRAVIEGGTVELAKAGALGTGFVQFTEPTTGSAVLQIDAGDAPAAGGTFANTLSNFSGANDDIDLRNIAYVAGATAQIMGTALVLTDGGNTYVFNIAGSTASLYPVLSDGHGGTLIDPKAAGLTQAMAGFSPPSAAEPIARTMSAAETPFLHATATASAGRP